MGVRELQATRSPTDTAARARKVLEDLQLCRELALAQIRNGEDLEGSIWATFTRGGSEYERQRDQNLETLKKLHKEVRTLRKEHRRPELIDLDHSLPRTIDHCKACIRINKSRLEKGYRFLCAALQENQQEPRYYLDDVTQEVIEES
ncbi:MAG: hypothetical protein A49_11900 [Methyloceanibacter sp.]|nr:MAG: hypothetical protein A49_11900 [Methyloceanibacter sp.]